MKIKTITTALSAGILALSISGCGISQEEMSSKPYIAVIEGVSTVGCISLDVALDSVVRSNTFGVVSISHQHTDEDVNCATYNKDDKHCTQKSFYDVNILNDQEDTNASGEGTCVLGADADIFGWLF